MSYSFGLMLLPTWLIEDLKNQALELDMKTSDLISIRLIEYRTGILRHRFDSNEEFFEAAEKAYALLKLKHLVPEEVCFKGENNEIKT